MDQAIADAVEFYYQLAEEIYGRKFLRPRLASNLRGRTAGIANVSKGLIRFNMALFQGNRKEFLERTVPHEVAHLIARLIHSYRIKPHGHEWRAVMHKLGVKDVTRCHSYDVSKIVNRPFVYKCSCREYPLSPIMHKRAQSGRCYFCRICKKTLTFIEVRRTA